MTLALRQTWNLILIWVSQETTTRNARVAAALWRVMRTNYGSMPEDIPHGSLDDEEAYYQGDEEEYDQDDEEEYYQGDEEEYNQDDDEAYYQGDEEEYDQDDEEADYQEGEQQSDTTAAMNTFAASLQGFRGTAGKV